MEKKEYQYVFDVWAYNHRFDPISMEITQEMRNNIIEESENKEKFARCRDTQYKFIYDIVEESSKLKDFSSTMNLSPKLKCGVLVFNLIHQNRFITQEISEKVTKLKEIIETDKKDIVDWIFNESTDLST